MNMKKIQKKIKSTLQYIKYHVIDDTKLNQSPASYAGGGCRPAFIKHLCACSVTKSWRFCGPMDCSPQAPLSIGFPRQEYWRGLPFPPSGDLPDPKMDLCLCVSHIGRWTTSATWGEQLNT